MSISNGSLVRNAWYVVGTGEDVGRSLQQCWLLDEPVVVFRAEAGTPVVLADRCSHRRYPLSKGTLVGDRLVCGYHGFTYACDGRCIAVPGQDRVPPRARLRSYPVHERDGWLWAWAGDSARAEVGAVPSLPWMSDPGWAHSTGFHRVGARYGLLLDNLLDLSHEAYVHPTSIGTPEIAHTPITVRTDGDKVYVQRVMVRVECPPLFTKAMGLSTPIDRWQTVEYIAPSTIVVHVGAAPAGTSHEPTHQLKIVNAITPAGDTRTSYFFGACRNFRIDDDSVTELLRTANHRVFAEDVEALEAQEAMVATDHGDQFECAVKCDGGVVHARRVIERLAEAERANLP